MQPQHYFNDHCQRRSEWWDINSTVWCVYRKAAIWRFCTSSLNRCYTPYMQRTHSWEIPLHPRTTARLVAPPPSPAGGKTRDISLQLVETPARPSLLSLTLLFELSSSLAEDAVRCILCRDGGSYWLAIHTGAENTRSTNYLLPFACVV